MSMAAIYKRIAFFLMLPLVFTLECNYKDIPSFCDYGELCATMRNDHYRGCRCDQSCSLYKDCCRDSPWFKPAELPVNDFTCVQLPGLLQEYKMIARCPNKATPEEHQLCNTPDKADPIYSMIPITVTTDDNMTLTYRNVYCALCNGVIDVDYQLWETQFQCRCNSFPCLDDALLEGEREMAFFDSDKNEWIIVKGDKKFGCDVSFVDIPSETVRSGHYRTCWQGTYINNCPPDWPFSKSAHLCRSYTAEIRNMYADVVYKNQYCALCNRAAFDNIKCIPSVYQTFHEPRLGFDRSVPRPYMLAGSSVSNYMIKPFFTLLAIEPTCTRNQKGCSLLSPKEKPMEELVTEEFVTTSLKADSRENTPKTKMLELLPQSSEVSYAVVGEEPTKQEGTIYIITGMVTTVGLCLSIFFLIIHLFAVILLPELHNLSGINLASLCVALLGAYAFYIAGSFLSGGPEIWCYRIAIMTYYFFMATFFWMLIIAFDISKVLRTSLRNFQLTRGFKWKRFLLYSTTAWGCPVALAVGVHLMEQAADDSVDSRFKPNVSLELCWFSNQESLTVFFLVPLTIIMVVNIGAFLYATFATSGSALGQRKNTVYFRLIVLLGLTWIIGLLPSSPLGRQMPEELSTAMWVIFSILNTLQGFFIFVSFTLTPKVLKGISKHFPCFKTFIHSSNQESSHRQSELSGTTEVFVSSTPTI